MIGKGMCPNCHGKLKTVKADYIECQSTGVDGCRLHGNPEFMKFCEHVPIFKLVTQESPAKGQLYKHSFGDKDSYYTLAGTVEGCGREVYDEYCKSCRDFLPHPVDSMGHRSASKPARAEYRRKSFSD
jgi:hypothetical protein